MATNNDITLILDNGGGYTLQITNRDGADWQHSYDDAAQCYDDIIAALAGDNPVHWDGNELDDEDIDYLAPTDDEVRNGVYRVYSIESIDDIRAIGDDSWGQGVNIAALAGWVSNDD